METMGKRLERIRKSQKKTIKELALEVGVPASTYRDWEYGREIKGEPYLRLATALKISLHELMGVSKADFSNIISKIKDIQDELRNLENDLQSLL